MNPPPIRSGHTRAIGLVQATLMGAALLGLGVFSAFAADDASDTKTVDQPTFTVKFPANWHVATDDMDYKAASNFILQSPNKTYVQFNIDDKIGDVKKVLDSAAFNLNDSMTTLSKSDFDDWGGHAGKGVNMKGKILDSPGGIRVFVFNSNKHNILVVEYYYSSELKEAMSDMDFISKSFTMKD